MILSHAKHFANRLLRPANVRIETLTAERVEDARLAEVERSGNFEGPVFPVPESFHQHHFTEIVSELQKHRERFADFSRTDANDVGYSFDNHYFSSPDTEVLYTLIRYLKPGKVVEIGSGNSTRITRQAILDGGTETQLISVDPQPRTDVVGFADEVYRHRLETLWVEGSFSQLDAGDVLFIDSSHKVQTGNDVITLLLQIVPTLPPGVILHVHDVFLPYDYPKRWVLKKKWGWNEQYLIQGMLFWSDAFEVLWPGHYLQRTRDDFSEYFTQAPAGVAKSLWLRKRV